MKTFLLACGFLLLVGLPAAAAETGYSGVIEDLPLMPQMAERTDEALVFDKPNGRIVEIGADVAASVGEIRNFYRDALPPLGWKILSENSFSRDNEMLEITVEPQEGKNLVRFNLTPKGK